VSISLDATDVAACEFADANTDDNVSVGEIIGGVNNALAGCP
jgi:hypothetical protein